jgi:hypothetical protein
MEIPIIRIYQDSDREKQAELTNYSKEDISFNDLPFGDYALVKIESLNDRIAVDKFMENLKNNGKA